MPSPISYENGLILEVADDMMSATIKLDREENKSPVTEKSVLDALKSTGIVVDDEVQQHVAKFVNLEPQDQVPSEPFVIARGTPPYDGKDETFQWDPAFEEQKKAWQDDAQVNYYNLSNIITVPQDTIIGTIQPIEPQRDGQDITGKILKPRGKPPVSIKLDHTVRQDPENPTKIFSHVSGCVKLDNNSVSIDEVLEIKGDVSFATGNINSDVAVHIAGTIPDRFEVRSKKSITVEMTIEAALVHAGEDVTVRRGIVGRSAGIVHAKGDIVAKYYSEANLIAEGNLMITSQLLHCRVNTDGKIIGTHASIIGGCLYAQEGGEVTDLGSDAGTPTRIFIGTRPDILQEEAAIDSSLQAKREAIQRIHEKLQPLLDNIKQLAPSQREQATELIFKAQEAEAQIEAEEKRQKHLAQSVEIQSQPKLAISGMIYPDVTISIGLRTVMFHNELKGPTVIEQRKIRNVTEIVAVNSLTGSVKILKSRRLTKNELLHEFEPIQKLGEIEMTAQPAAQYADQSE